MFEQIALFSCVTACISFTVAETKLFAQVRVGAAKLWSWLGSLVSCGYCLGHWIAFALVAIYKPRLFYCVWPLDYFLTALLIAWLAAFQWAGLCWLVLRLNK